MCSPITQATLTISVSCTLAGACDQWLIEISLLNVCSFATAATQLQVSYQLQVTQIYNHRLEAAY